jgi:hypothetical protein
MNYLNTLSSALKSRGAKETYFPMDKELRATRQQKLAREIGYAAKDKEQARDFAQSGYGKLLVANSLDSTGVVLSMREWLTGIMEGYDRQNRRT